jgi:hypothetical protein
MIGFLLRFYPARWGARYGDEFAALLDERPLGPFDVADVLLGALDAHLHLRGLGAASEHAKGFAMSLRIGGFAAIAGGILWFSGLALSSVFQGSAAVFVLAFGVGTLALLIALVGLSAFQARQYPRLVWAAFFVPALGAVVSLIGMAGMATTGDLPFIGSWSAWSVWAIGVVTLIVGSALFGIATLRARALSRAAAATLAISSIVVIPILLGVGVLDGLLPEAAAPLGMALAALAFAGGWVGLGVSALRIDGARPAAQAGGTA